MRERGLLFSGPMVRAILAGRKTQTRRAMRTSHVGYHSFVRWDGAPYRRAMMRCLNDPGIVTGDPHLASVFCEDNRYGVPGDRLWVRETWQQIGASTDELGHVDDLWALEALDPDHPEEVVYREVGEGNIPWDDHVDDRGFAWRPSLLMPRWASRITLDILNIRVERAHDISDADIAAEGVDAGAVEALWQGATKKRRGEVWHPNGAPAFDAMRPRDLWRAAWTLINGRASWDANPWVWVIDFRRALESEPK